MRRFAASLIVLCVGVASPSAQQAARKSFEVASIKPAPPLSPEKLLSGQQRIGMKVDAARVDIESVGIAELINLAFKITPNRVTGPGWSGVPGALAAPRFDIHATLPAGATRDDVPEMLQSLLAERFKMEYHLEQKDQAVYALVQDKSGAKLQAAPELPPDAPAAGGTNRPDPVQVSGNPQSGMVIKGPGNNGALRMNMSPDGMMHLEADRLTMQQLANSLTNFAGRPVIDQTGLEGAYKVGLDLSRDDMLSAARAAGVNIPAIPGAGGGAVDPAGTSIFRSVENMGLKLEPKKAPVEYLVIDRMEKMPTED